MEVLTVTVLEPKAKKLLDDLANLNLIEVREAEKPKNENLEMNNSTVRKAGSAKGKYELSSDFDAPLEDFEDYM